MTKRIGTKDLERAGRGSLNARLGENLKRTHSGRRKTNLLRGLSGVFVVVALGTLLLAFLAG